MTGQDQRENVGNSGDNYSHISVTNSPGSAVGRGASASYTTHGIDGEDLELIFTHVNELIERLNPSQYDKQRLKYIASDLHEELAKSEPDGGFVKRCWNNLKDVAEIASQLLPIVQPFLQQG